LRCETHGSGDAAPRCVAAGPDVDRGLPASGAPGGAGRSRDRTPRGLAGRGFPAKIALLHPGDSMDLTAALAENRARVDEFITATQQVAGSWTTPVRPGKWS